MERVSKHSPFESQRQTQPKSKSDDEKKKGKQEKKQKQKYRNLNEMMYGPGGKPKGVVIGDRVFANEYDSDKPPASKRRRHVHSTEVKSWSYSLRSENEDSEEKEPKGKEKEEEIEQKGKNIIAEGYDGESDSFSLEPEMHEIYIQLEELSW